MHLDRRAMLQRALWLAGAAAVPGFTSEVLAQAAKKPRLLDPRKFALLTAVADTFVPRTDTPGAIDAGVPASVDAMLRDWASPTRRADLVAVLGKIDAAAGPRGFVKLASAKRKEVLAAYDVAALKPTPSDEPAAPSLKAAPSVTDPNYGRLKQEPADGKAPQSVFGEQGSESRPRARRSFMDRGAAVSDPAYAKLKELIVVLYYYSEPALTQELRYEHAPGQWQPSIPVTPQTRPWGGAGGI